MLAILRDRRQKMPRNVANCGSVFKSDPRLYSTVGPPGAVIERLGFKGLRRGGAQVSDQHANFMQQCRDIQQHLMPRVQPMLVAQLIKQFPRQFRDISRVHLVKVKSASQRNRRSHDLVTKLSRPASAHCHVK